ncbi:MAG TPA: SBBP repeat-containing protein, partial [bacterium]|nr:SBBP repeat-containing protein [bacterium]
SDGRVVVVGWSNSQDYPLAGTWARPRSSETLSEGVVSVFDSEGRMQWSSYLGGLMDDQCQSVGMDEDFSIYVCGWTSSQDFPLQGFYARNPGGTYGQDAFVTKFLWDGMLDWSTYLGGYNADQGHSVTVAPDGMCYVAGSTLSDDFPVTSDSPYPFGSSYWAGFLTRYSPEGAIVWSTCLAGSLSDECYAVAMDNGRNAYVTGRTDSLDFPLLAPFSSTALPRDTFVSKYALEGHRVWSTYLGVLGNDEGRGIVVDQNGDVVVTGISAPHFPVPPANLALTEDTTPYNCFATKISQKHDFYVHAEKGNDLSGDGSQTNPWQSITTGLKAAPAGTSDALTNIHVSSAIYSENAVFQNQYTKVFGGYNPEKWDDRDLKAYPTTVDGRMAGPCFAGARGIDIRLDGLTIRNGFSDQVSGGGIQGWTNVLLDDCIVTGCMVAIGDGGGVYGTRVEARRCTFSSNSANSGGGIYGYQVLAENCFFNGNSASSPYAKGGAVWGEYAEVRGCSFQYNTISGDGECRGGGLAGSLLDISDSHFEGNNSGYYGGGIAVCPTEGNMRGLAMTNTHILNNKSTSRGGGIHSVYVLSVTDSVIQGNESDVGAGVCVDGLTVGSVFRSRILSNVATGAGGGVSGSIVKLRECLLSGNAASENGGAISVFFPSPGAAGFEPVVSECIIRDNSAISGGGLMQS